MMRWLVVILLGRLLFPGMEGRAQEGRSKPVQPTTVATSAFFDPVLREIEGWKVHITQARDLLSRSQMLKHPAVILHELAHGYHDQILGFDHPEILAAYAKAKEAGTYTHVLLYTGEKVKHYALTDPKEYFAEGTEAYLYRNDFFPFVRAELKGHDPVLHEVLLKVWGPAQ